jgi:hypothetical protein
LPFRQSTIALLTDPLGVILTEDRIKWRLKQ